MENLLGWAIVVIAIVAPILIGVGFYKWRKGAKEREAKAIAKADKEAIDEQRKRIAARKEVVQQYANYTPSRKTASSSYTSTATTPAPTSTSSTSSGLDTSDVILGAMLINSMFNNEAAAKSSYNSDSGDVYSGSTFSTPSSDYSRDTSDNGSSSSSGPSFSMPDGSWSSSDSSSDSSSSWSSDSGSSSSDW